MSVNATASRFGVTGFLFVDNVGVSEHRGPDIVP